MRLLTQLSRGETGLETSKEDRAANEVAHASASTNKRVAPRKADCKLVASVVKGKKWDFKTISNFEMKSPQACSQQVEIQTRKNIRLNHTISKNIPATKLYFLDMHGTCRKYVYGFVIVALLLLRL